MATDNLVESLQEEATCSICLEYFKDSITIDCGHNFCRTCIAQCWERPDTDVSYPQCRETVQQETNLRLNRKLANVVEIAKRFSLQAAKGAGEERVCGEHQETLKLFCEEDQTSVCVVCHLSRDHRDHRVVPIQEAAQEYKEKLQGALGPLRKELEEALALMSAEEEKTTEWQPGDEPMGKKVCSDSSASYGEIPAGSVGGVRKTPAAGMRGEGKVKNRREMIAGEFNKLHTLLREEEQLLLQSLEEEERETLQRLQENVTKLSQQSSSLQQLITEMEEKCQQPVVELLKDVKSTLSRSENVKLQKPEAVSTDLENVYKISLDMREALKRFGVDVTLDPDTANPWLVLSEDRKRVRHGDKRQDLPNNSERFDYCVFVLGAEGFAGGRCYWEVEVGDKTGWDLGVCRESVNRKGWVTLSPEDGFWAIWLRDGGYKALTSTPTPLPMSVRPSRVGIFLDYEAGEVSFYNVTDRSHLYTFTDTFSGKLCPYFCPCNNAGGKNAAPLIICPVPAQAGGNLCP
ncbi:LOW QUALITY PROTEIN: E3 ubiquitin-protein ligase TRIM39-like [Gopherus evgoodei]|uniref:LOW QUALITY PROTEIN: E3 ubiquitin-protein ligase TRIM39-like n=1 Tax=Gopherus evgoodei TaxID=1825980 RepID=UPI0011CF1BAC|nr:LOW QUALITY PROTEIN: E3 ubiquitin-protein ligase TRIM39-like [Gopherus evgoodei]